MKKSFIFCHGFGLSKNFWKNLAPYFSKEECSYLDLGYFGHKIESEFENDNVSLIGIGHSLGFPKLLSLNKKLDYLIGLNSFIDFLGNDYNIRQKRTRELKILKESFIMSPTETLTRFYKRCGFSVEIQNPEKIKKEIALNDLQFLSNTFYIPPKIPTLIIGSKDDIIVPPEILYDNFNKYSNAIIQIIEYGKHGLGFLEPDTVYQKITNFLNDNY